MLIILGIIISFTVLFVASLCRLQTKCEIRENEIFKTYTR